MGLSPMEPSAGFILVPGSWIWARREMCSRACLPPHFCSRAPEHVAEAEWEHSLDCPRREHPFSQGQAQGRPLQVLLHEPKLQTERVTRSPCTWLTRKHSVCRFKRAGESCVSRDCLHPRSMPKTQTKSLLLYSQEMPSKPNQRLRCLAVPQAARTGLLGRSSSISNKKR